MKPIVNKEIEKEIKALLKEADKLYNGSDEDFEKASNLYQKAYDVLYEYLENKKVQLTFTFEFDEVDTNSIVDTFDGSRKGLNTIICDEILTMFQNRVNYHGDYTFNIAVK